MASLEPWFDRHGDRNPQLVNMYGITETTVHVTYCPLSKPNLSRGSLIGVPIPDLELHVLDENLQPVPLGVAGEIFVGGAGVARGYCNRPDLTAARFIPDPFSSVPGARLYRTGDRARRLADRNHEYLGRLDRQVKVRGFRVELPEIEIALNKHPAVDSSAVITADDATGQNRLWAYFIPRAGSLPDGASLRAFLAQHLPEYMIPAGFTAIECWPLTANGKLDRASLPPPSYDSSGALLSRQMSSTEARLLSWCRDIVADLCLDVDQPLLDAGLHSLAFAQLAARIHTEFRVWPAFSELFACRTVAELANLVGEKAADRNSPVELVVPRERRGPLPLSLPQERIWFLERLHPRNLAYHFQSILRFHGRLDVPALEKSLHHLVMRHEILRTTFPEVSGQPCQQIHPFASFSLAVEEVSLKRAEQRIAEAIRQPFDIERVPPVRWLLLRISAEQHWLLHMQQHLLHDGAEYEVFLKELFASYDAFAAGRAPVLSPLSVQFADFAIWQRQQLAAGRWDGQLEYWQKRLKAPPPAAQLPVDRQRSFAQTFAGAQIRHPFDAKFYAQLFAACAREGVTPHMWLHAAFQAFLFRYTGQSDIVVGTGVANRESAEAQKLLGMIINTVALRISFAGKPSFRDILARTRAAIVEALDNQNAPFDRVVQRLGGGSVLFNTFFDSYDRAYPALRNDVLRVEQDIAINNGTCKFELVALVVPGNGTPATLLWEYNTDLFTEQTASRMMRHFLTLLAESVADPSLQVALLPMLGQEEKNCVIEACRAKSSPSWPDHRLDQMFAAVVSAHPDSVAIVCGNEKLTYRELDLRAARLADELRAFGACNGQVVAFSLPRSPQAICVMAAILKSGCAYLPLDPKLPSNRRTLMLQAAGSSLLLTADGIARVASGPQQCPNLLPEDAACVLFTSGSTGVPKPVSVLHRAIARLVCDVDYVRLNADTRFLQLAPLTFDASSLEIWGPLLNGGAAIIHPEDLPNFAELGRTIASHGVTTAWLTASLLNQIIDAAPEILRPLRQLLTGGEALSVPHVVRALAALPGTTLINGYGPTEGTTFSTTFTIPRDFDFAVGRVPIGRPIPGTQVYVLDEYQQLLPIGVPGEICIGGIGLAAGYLGDAALTAAKFVPDTISGLPGARLYRTGDCGRLLADGTLDCIGRLDRQVKIRGFRIEPGEIEAALLRHPCVTQAVVIAREDTPGDKRLVAYVVGASDQTIDAGALRAHLRRSLPSYMVPSHIVVLDSFPIASSGKIDRNALPPPYREAARPVAFRTPSDDRERELLAIWQDVLKNPKIGIDDDFFELGGTSLQLLRVFLEIEARLGCSLSPTTMLQAPTIARLAEFTRASRGVAESQSLVPLRASGKGLPLFFVNVGLWFGHYHHLLSDLKSDRPVFGLQPLPLDGKHRIARTIELMAADYVTEMRRMQPHGPYFLAGYCSGGWVSFEIAQQLVRAGERVGFLGLIDTIFYNMPARVSEAAHRSHRVRGVHGFRELLFWGLKYALFRGLSFMENIRYLMLDLWIQRGRSIPNEHRNTYYVWLCSRANRHYMPKPYPGHIAVFSSADNSERQRAHWGSLALGGLTVLEVPAPHADMCSLPHSKLIAERFDDCLDAAAAAY